MFREVAREPEAEEAENRTGNGDKEEMLVDIFINGERRASERHQLK
jgi:hypothetical protein